MPDLAKTWPAISGRPLASTLLRLAPVDSADISKPAKPAEREELFGAERYLRRAWKPPSRAQRSAPSRASTSSRWLIGVEAQSGRVVGRPCARRPLGVILSGPLIAATWTANPTPNIRARAQGGARERVLNEAELAAIWNACDGEDDFSRIVRLLILTGQRRAEIGHLAWPEINPEKRQIELPGPHQEWALTVWVLSDAALNVIQAIPRQSARDLVFGTGHGGFSGWSKCERQLDKKLALISGAKSMASWTLHDIRRSVVTHLHGRGFAPPSCSGGDRQSRFRTSGWCRRNLQLARHYLTERRQALLLWGAHIAGIG